MDESSSYWTRWNRRRISRRTLLAGSATAALGGAAALIVGCGSDDDPISGSPTAVRSPGVPGEPVAGGNITQGFLLAIGGLDPHVDLTGLFLVPRLYSYLYSWRPFAEEAIFNNLATALEMPSPDHTEFVFTLRPGVKFMTSPKNPASGEEVTSEDVKASFIRRGTSFTAPDKRFPLRISGTKTPDPVALAAALQTPDPYTFSFKMSTPFIPAVREMSNATWAIMPAKAIDKYLYFSDQAYGSGPFTLESFRGYERIVFAKHQDYFLKPRPWLDTITYVIITEASSLLAAFDSGKHDINGALLTRKQGEERKKDPKFIVSDAPTRFYPVIHFKCNPNLPFGDVRVREAVDLALNRDEMIDVLWDGNGSYNGPVQYLMERFSLPQDELRASMPHDIAKARALLTAAGYENGLDVKMKLPKVPGAPFIADLASLIKDQLREAGINVLLDEVELTTFIVNTILPGNFEMAFFPNLPYDEPDRPLSFYHTRGVTGLLNWNNYSNPEVDKMIESQEADFDEPHRIQTILDVQRLMIKEHGPQITMPGGNFYQARWSYVHVPYLFGEDPTLESGPDGVDIWTEKV
jgi:ABC-type transport system substrate-binding protein